MLARSIIVFSIASFYGVYCAQDNGETFWLIKEPHQTHKKITTDDLHDEISPNTEKVVFIVHGRYDNKSTGWFDWLSAPILERHPTWNVVVIDWSTPAKSPVYGESQARVPSVGEKVGIFITKMMEKCENITGDKIILIGHSLGAHVMGYAGKYVQKTRGEKISRILGLEPASPLFTGNPCEHRLCKTDAKYLSVIHTDIGKYGMPDAIGHSDFYPNFSANQPGCEASPTKIVTIHVCNHFRSIYFTVEAMKNPTHFLASKCFIKINGACDGEEVHMGSLSEKPEGVYFLKTNAKSPFSINQ